MYNLTKLHQNAIFPLRIAVICFFVFLLPRISEACHVPPTLSSNSSSTDCAAAEISVSLQYTMATSTGNSYPCTYTFIIDPDGTGPAASYIAPNSLTFGSDGDGDGETFTFIQDLPFCPGGYVSVQTGSSSGTALSTFSANIFPTAPCNVGPNAAFSISPGTTIAAGTTATLTATQATNPNGPFPYFSQSFSGSYVSGSTFTAPCTPGTYTVTNTVSMVGPSGCLDTESQTITVTGLNAPVNTTVNNSCGPPLVAGVISATCASGSLQWYSNAGATIPISAPTYSSTASTYYCTCEANGCKSAVTTVVTAPTPCCSNPSAPTVTPNADCYNETVTLSSNPCSAGSTITWFSDAALTNQLATGASYTTPTLTSTTTYYVACVDNTDPTCISPGTAVIATIHPLPTPNAGTYGPFCISASGLALSGTPTGGTFSGTGVSSNIFTPSTAGAGTHTITYTYTDANGCTNIATTNIVVNPLPTPNAGTYGPYCINAAAVTLAGTPTGGTFSGTGVSGTTFTPSAAGAGTHTITYTYTDANGCTNTATTNIVVNPLPTPNAGTYEPYCINAAAVTLAGTPTGGTFSGTGVSGTSFTPSTAGAGTHTITYTYTDANGCTNTATTNIVVNPLPTPNAGTYGPYCIDAAAITLAGTPTGGTFSGAGVSGTTFTPSTAGAGTHTITYSYTDANGCTNTATTNIVVNPLPTPNAGTYGPYCINATAVTLAGTPTGGTFSGTGVSGTTFTPSTAGAGTHTITYTYTDANGCTNTATTNIVVNPLPTPSAGTYGPYCIDAATVTLAGTPTGGTFSGTGVSGTSFTPSTAGAGTHIITYTYTDANGCTNTATTNIVVNPLPTPNAGTYGPYCIDAAAVTLAGTPTGGTFSGTGVSGTTFTPSTAGAGTHTITYTYTDANGCTNTATTNIVVNPLPTPNAGTYGPYCIDAAAVTLAGTPTGGTFSGTGVSGTTFTPSTAGAGTHTITYTYTDANGCTNTATTNIVVNTLPTPNAGTYGPYCIDAAAVTLAGTPTGGTFSGTGVSGTTFTPSTAGAGTHTITYTYTDANGCTNTATTNIVVNPLPTPNAGTYGPYCINAAAVTLAGTPTGGTFSGTGVSGTSFTPSTAGAGTHTITYTYTDANGCTNTATTNIVVNPLPTPNAGTYGPYCIDAAAVTLAGTPTGGTFSGTGVSGTSFTPSTAGAGTHTVTYTYTDANGCTNTATTNIVVNPLPTPNAGTYGPYCIDAAAVTLVGTPIGGTFSGTGMSGSSFSPNIAGNGNHTITYTYTDANGCTNSDTTIIVVNPLPTPNAGTYGSFCLNDNSIALLGTPTGGVFSGAGVSAGIFDPQLAGVGTHVVSYSYSSGFGCVVVDTTLIIVNSIPTALAGSYSDMCIYDPAITLSGTPVGGSFVGPGITGNTFDPAIAGAGLHSIIYTFSDMNGCMAYDTTTINVISTPILIVTNPTPVCMPNTIDLTDPTITAGSSAGIYGYYTDINLMSAIPDPTQVGQGTYYISLTNTGGCVSSAPVNVIINNIPNLIITDPAPICVPNCVDITASAVTSGSDPGTLSYYQDPALTMVLPSPSCITNSGTYYIVLDNGCQTSQPVNVTINPIPVLNVTDPAAVCTPNTVDITASAVTSGSSAGTLNYWQDAALTMPIANPSMIATSGTYYISLVSSGCMSSAPVDVTINPLPIVTMDGLSPVYCPTDPDVSVGLTPPMSSGIGVFSGPGVIAGTNVFQPSTLPLGAAVTLTYDFTDINGCMNTASQNVSIGTEPNANVNGINVQYCINDAPDVFIPVTPTGTFYIDGVISPTVGFDPATAGVGTHTFVYCATTGLGCVNCDTFTTYVNPLPIVSFTGLDATYCVGDVSDDLIPSPGGTFSGPGISGTTFHPGGTMGAGVGTHSISLTYTDPTTLCTNSISQTTTVLDTASAVFTGLAPGYCLTDPCVTLTPVTNGGAFTGDGMFANQFCPTSAGLGVHSICYTVSLGGCVTDYCLNVAVFPDYPPTISGYQPNYCIDDNAITLSADIAGGSFAGTGIVGNIFNPASAGLGTHMITYSYSTATGCSNADTIFITVNPIPNPSFIADQNICVGDPTHIVYTGSTADVQTYTWDFDGASQVSGTGSGPYDVEWSAAGTYDVSVEVASPLGCTADTSMAINAHATFVSTIEDITINIGESVTLITDAFPSSINLSFSWSPSTGLSCTDCQNPVASPFVPTTYTVTVSDSLGCISQDQVIVDVFVDYTVYVPNAFTPNEDGENDFFSVYGKNIKDIKFDVYNRWGEKVFEALDLSKSWDGTYKGQKVNPGVYVWVADVTFLNDVKQVLKGNVTVVR